MRLTHGTDRCRCGGCGEHFNSTAAFDKHRTGTHGVDRRCLTPDEMRALDMAKNATGWWVTERMPDSRRVARCGDRPATHSEVAG